MRFLTLDIQINRSVNLRSDKASYGTAGEHCEFRWVRGVFTTGLIMPTVEDGPKLVSFIVLFVLVAADLGVIESLSSFNGVDVVTGW